MSFLSNFFDHLVHKPTTEHLYSFGLINMNGRLYDPILGRMLSPDIVIQDEQSSQAYNRYSYCFNNPLRFTDPSGYVVTIPPEFEKYYMPEYLNDFDTYKKEFEKLDAQNVAFNTPTYSHPLDI